MAIMKHRRRWQVIKYGWRDSGEIVSSHEVKKSRFSIFIDIINCFRRYYLFSNQYKSQLLWTFTNERKSQIANHLGKVNRERDEWLDNNYENRKFLSKYSQFKYETSPRLMQKRQRLYRERYNMGSGCVLQNDVIITQEHGLRGSIRIGNNVLLAKHVFLDYSGELIIHDNVSITQNVIIETHTHPFEKKGEPVPGKLVIEQGAAIFSRAYIADTCHSIGRYALVGAGAYVRKNVPPYAVMIGNPGKIIGFRMSPDDIVEFEKDKFKEEDRIPKEILQKNYETFFLNRWKEIKEFVKV